MKKKIDILIEMAAQGNWHGAIKLAGSFPRLGDDRKAIMQAKEAVLRPEFQRQLGRDPEQLIETGIQVMRAKWSL